MSFSELGLSSELLRALQTQGYDEPTPIQRQAIPIVLQCRDLLAGAQTGTGKTAGFTLPMLQLLSGNARQPAAKAPRKVRALILTPTRELAAQVGESVRDYGRHLPLRSTIIFGGVNINPQIQQLREGADIVIATPGRLLDHAGQRTIDLRHIEILVLDEADRMLDMGFIRDIRRVLALLPAQRQNLLFSATFSDEIRALARDLLDDPAEIQVARRNAPAEAVSQVVHPVAASRKRELLSVMIGSNNWRQVLVFTRTKHGANRLSEKLCRDGLSAAAIHGNKSQGARTRALAGFKSGEVRVLVATDIAARGLDIDQLPHVVNFELPSVPEDYVHRIGRTGRAGASGHAVSLVSPDEGKLLTAIERLLGRRLERQLIDGYQTEAEHSDDADRSFNERTRQGRAGGQARRSSAANPGVSASPAGRGGSGQAPRSKPGSVKSGPPKSGAPKRGAVKNGAAAQAGPGRSSGAKPAPAKPGPANQGSAKPAGAQAKPGSAERARAGGFRAGRAGTGRARPRTEAR
ncbi:MAG: DEAD/DEAH box helicase [Burkholderiaceae bacterium]